MLGGEKESAQVTVFDYVPSIHGLTIMVNDKPFGSAAWSHGEIDYQVDRLRKELDGLAAKMKRDAPKHHKAIVGGLRTDAHRT